MSTEQVLKDLNDQRLSAWEAGKAILERATEERRALTAEEQEEWDRADDDLTALDRTIQSIIVDETRQRERDALNAEYERAFTPRELEDARTAEARQVAEFFGPGTGKRTIEVSLDNAARWHEAYRQGARGQELRVVAGDTGASGGSLTVPTEVASSIYEYMTASVALRRMNTTVITTTGGNNISFPKVGTHGIATQVANQDTALAGTDPVLGEVTLSAYDSGQLVQVARDLVEDTAVDILDFVARNIGRAIGEHTAAWYVTGSGSSQPTGVMNISGIGSANTGGSLIDPTFESLIDLEFTVTDSYRPMAEWLMRDATAKVLRKLRDGNAGTIGAFLWVPSQQVGMSVRQPDTLMGYPAFTDPNVASLASNAKVIAFGDFSSYYIRDVAGLRLERSDDFAFDKDQIAFRGKLRTDADGLDSNAIAIQKRNV